MKGMSEKVTWEAIYEAEMQNAEAARRIGNEGKARVCARRAAGAVIGEYLNQRGIIVSKNSSFDRLKQLISLPEIAPVVKEIASHLLQHVSTEHNLPLGIDLIAEVKILEQELLSKP
jgi:hypothetical protein